MLKVFITIIAVISGFLVIAGLLLQIDDELQPEVIQFMSLSESQDENKAYFYLLGLTSKEGDDPLLIGQKIYQDIKQQQAEINADKNAQQSIDITQYDKLALPKSPLLCAYIKANCFEHIFNHLAEIPSLVTSTEVFVQRYLTYSAFSEFHTLSQPHTAEPFPPYQHLVTAVHLMSLDNISRASQGEEESAIQALYQLHQQLRSQLSRQDTLIGKFIFLNLVSENIDLMSVLSTRYQVKLPKALTSLTKKERSFSLAFSREVRMIYSLYQTLDGATDILNINHDLSAFVVPSWFSHILFKVNITTNEAYQPLHYYAMLSELPIEDFDQEIRAVVRQLTINSDWLRNAIGTVLNQVATPDHTHYIANFWDLDNKIQLFNARVQNFSTEKIMRDVKNKYPLPANISPYLSVNKHKLCFENPFNTDAKYNCLQINY